MTQKAALLAVLFVMLIACDTTRAQNLLANGDFASDLSSWQQVPDAMPVWSSFDVANSATSGSVLGTNSAAAEGASSFVLRQCVPITKGGLYVLGASAYTPIDQVGGDLIASYSVFATSDCSSGFFRGGGISLPSIGLWRAYTSGTILNLPAPLPPQASILVSLRLDKTPAGGTFNGYFDNVFLVYDPIYADHFE